MKLVNVISSHSRPILNQSESIDAHLVKTYIAGSTAIVYIEAPEHNEISSVNDKRRVQPKEIEGAKNYFLDKTKDAACHEDEIKVIELAGLVEISIPKHELDATLAV